MKRKFLIATMLVAGVAMSAAAAFAGPNISDKRYWPNETADNGPYEAFASVRRAPVIQTVPQVTTDQYRGRASESGRYQGGPKSGLIAR